MYHFICSLWCACVCVRVCVLVYLKLNRLSRSNYSGREAPSLKIGSVCLFVWGFTFVFLGGSTSGVYADWLARHQ